jgi:hypothetical protein
VRERRRRGVREEECEGRERDRTKIQYAKGEKEGKYRKDAPFLTNSTVSSFPHPSFQFASQYP